MGLWGWDFLLEGARLRKMLLKDKRCTKTVVISEAFLLLSRENGHRSFAQAGVLMG